MGYGVNLGPKLRFMVAYKIHGMKYSYRNDQKQHGGVSNILLIICSDLFGKPKVVHHNIIFNCQTPISRNNRV